MPFKVEIRIIEDTRITTTAVSKMLFSPNFLIPLDLGFKTIFKG